MSAFVDVTGQRFGRLIAIKVVDKYIHGKNTSMIWECRCDCGNIVKVTKSSLGRSTNSCGCLQRDTSRERGRKNKGKSKLPYGVAAKNKLFDHYKRAAEYRELLFDLSIDEFEYITQKPCYYCGIEPKQTTRDKNSFGQYIYNGIDRIDNSKGYILKNCVPCCGACNKAKLNMTIDEFYAWIDRLIEHRKKNMELAWDVA